MSDDHERPPPPPPPPPPPRVGSHRQLLLATTPLLLLVVAGVFFQSIAGGMGEEQRLHPMVMRFLGALPVLVLVLALAAPRAIRTALRNENLRPRNNRVAYLLGSVLLEVLLGVGGLLLLLAIAPAPDSLSFLAQARSPDGARIAYLYRRSDPCGYDVFVGGAGEWRLERTRTLRCRCPELRSDARPLWAQDRTRVVGPDDSAVRCTAPEE